MGQTAGSCRHCHTPVVRDLRGHWVHTSLRYRCADQWGTLMPTCAAPLPTTPAPQTNARGVATVVGRSR